MGDVNLEIKLSNLDERVIKIEESGGSGGDGYITSVSNDFNVVNKKLSLSNDITTKLAKVGEQIPGKVSGNTATFTDAKIGSSADVYLTDIYCSDSARYIKSQSVSGNTLTVTFDDSVAGTTCVLQLFKKGV